MAALIVASGEKGHRTATAKSRFALSRTTSAATQDASVDEIARQEVARIDGLLVDMFATATGRSPKVVRSLMATERSFYAANARNIGLIDRVVDESDR